MQNDALKLIVTLVYSFLVAFTPLEYYYYGLPVLLILFIERKHLQKIIKKVVLLNFFVLFLALFVAFENTTMALELFIRINCILLFTATLFFKSKGYDIIRGLNTLKISPLFITIFYFSLNMIEFLSNEVKSQKETLKVRGFKANTSLFTYQTFGNIFALMFIKALKKSQELQYSMQSRGFNGKIYLLTSNKITLNDIAVCGAMVSIVLIKGFVL
jgi:cobalt/nickel transport system permease protein